MVQYLNKNLLLVSKIIWGIWITLGKQQNVQKVEIQWATFVQEIDLSNITFNYLRENSPNSLCHFWNHKSFFITELACIILAQTLQTFDKNMPSKCKFSDFLLLELKFIKFLLSFFKQKMTFYSKFGSLFSVMRDNSSALF